MHTAGSSSRLTGGGSASVHAGIPTPLWEQTSLDHAPLPGPGSPRTRPPWEQTRPPDQATPDQATPPRADPPGTRHPPDQTNTTPDQPPPCGQTDTCKNITFTTLLGTVTRKHSSRMRTAHFLGRGGRGLPNHPVCRPPCRETPLDADPYTL